MFFLAQSDVVTVDVVGEKKKKTPLLQELPASAFLPLHIHHTPLLHKWVNGVKSVWICISERLFCQWYFSVEDFVSRLKHKWQERAFYINKKAKSSISKQTTIFSSYVCHLWKNHQINITPDLGLCSLQVRAHCIFLQFVAFPIQNARILQHVPPPWSLCYSKPRLRGSSPHAEILGCEKPRLSFEAKLCRKEFYRDDGI